MEPAWRTRLAAPAAVVAPLAVGDGLDAAVWADHEFGGARLGDARLSARLVQSAQQMAESPMRAITGAAHGARALVKGHYRLIDQPADSAVTVGNILARAEPESRAAARSPRNRAIRFGRCPGSQRDATVAPGAIAAVKVDETPDANSAIRVQRIPSSLQKRPGGEQQRGAEVGDREFGPARPLVPLGTVEERLVDHALRHAGSVAARIGAVRATGTPTGSNEGMDPGRRARQPRTSRQRRHQPGREPVVIERVDSQVENRSQTPVERLTARWPEDDTAWLTGFLQVIGEQYPNSVKAVIVYGSMARGDWHKDSDLDVLIVLSDEHAAERDAIELAGYGLSVRLETLPSILSLTETEWADEEGGSLHRETSRDGITVL